MCARLQLRANDCSRSQLIEHVLDDARQDQGAYRLLSNFNFDSLVEILKMSDGRVRLLQGMDTRCVMVKILMRWEQVNSQGKDRRAAIVVATCMPLNTSADHAPLVAVED